MRAAPPVSVRATGGNVWRAAQALLPALAAGACGAWAALTLDGPAWPAAPLALVAGLAGWWRSRTDPVALAWDGRSWTADGLPAQPTVAIDLGPWLLLGLRPAEAAQAAAPRRWLAVSAGEAGAAWHALRCALYAAQGPASDARPEGTAG